MNTANAIDGTGNAMDNIITGNDANNVLGGLAGNDTLIGGSGNDTFLFYRPLVADNFSTIIDFTVGSDKIALALTFFPGIALAANAFFEGAAAGDADDRLGYDPATGYLRYDADGNGAQADVASGSVTPGLAMTVNQLAIVQRARRTASQARGAPGTSGRSSTSSSPPAVTRGGERR